MSKNARCIINLNNKKIIKYDIKKSVKKINQNYKNIFIVYTKGDNYKKNNQRIKKRIEKHYLFF